MRTWHKSSFSGISGCVKVAVWDDRVHVRDGKDPGGPVLTFTWVEWDAFVAGVRNGEFDVPALRSGWGSRGQ